MENLKLLQPFPLFQKFILQCWLLFREGTLTYFVTGHSGSSMKLFSFLAISCCSSLEEWCISIRIHLPSASSHPCLSFSAFFSSFSASRTSVPKELLLSNSPYFYPLDFMKDSVVLPWNFFCNIWGIQCSEELNWNSTRHHPILIFVCFDKVLQSLSCYLFHSIDSYCHDFPRILVPNKMGGHGHDQWLSDLWDQAIRCLCSVHEDLVIPLSGTATETFAQRDKA